MQIKRPSWRAIIDDRRKENFIGRGDHIRFFLDNFNSDVPTFLMFAITGEGGVGKSTVLKQYQNVAAAPDINAITVICDDNHSSPVAVMGHIAEELVHFGVEHKDFNEQLKIYRARRSEIESDPKAPRGALNLILRGMTDLAIKTARRTPGVGVLAECVNEKEAGESLVQGINYLMDRFASHDEVRLLREPESVLSPLFIELLNKACRNRRVVLMFDVFERTGYAIEDWLLQCLSFKYGECDTYLTFVVSGRDPLDQHWTEMASSIHQARLEPFTIEETRLYLANRSITNNSLVDQIYKDTGGLPVLVELLAGTDPVPGVPLRDISKDAVKRFLQWIPEEDHRRAALLAAVPRQFNLDILCACLGSNSTNHFGWLSMQSYVRTSTSRGYFYHDKVRELMLRYLHNTITADLKAAHKQLADYLETLQDQLGLDMKSAYRSETWCKLEVEKIYHLLSDQPVGNASKALNAFLTPFQYSWGFTESIARACHQVARETATPEIQVWSQALINFYKAYDADDYKTVIDFATRFDCRKDLDSASQVALLMIRGHAFKCTDRLLEALADFGRAIALDETSVRVLEERGVTYLLMKRYDEALTDFDRSIKLGNNRHIVYEQRGLALRELKRFEEAIESLTEGSKRSSKCDVCLAHRGETYLLMKNYEKAVEDFDRAIELDNEFHWAYEERGQALQELKRYEEAIESLTEAIRISPTCRAGISKRGSTYRLLGDYEKAIADFDRVIEIDHENHWAYEERGRALLSLNRYEEAKESLTEAIKYSLNCSTCVACRGVVYRKMGKFEEALADFNHAIELNSNYHYAFEQKGRVLLALNRYEESIESLNEAHKTSPTCSSCIVFRGEAYRKMGKFEEALADFNHRINEDNNDKSSFFGRAETYRFMGKYEKALIDFDQVVKLDENCADAVAWRGEMRRRLNDNSGAISDFSLAVRLDKDDVFPRSRRAAAYLALGQSSAADADISYVMTSRQENAADFYNAAVASVLCEQLSKAIELLSKAIEIDSVALSYARNDDLFKSLTDITEFQRLVTIP